LVKLIRCEICGKKFRTQNIKLHMSSCKRKAKSINVKNNEFMKKIALIENRINNLEDMIKQNPIKETKEKEVISIFEEKFVRLLILFYLEIRDKNQINDIERFFNKIGISNQIINKILLRLFISGYIDFEPKVSVELEKLIRLLWNKNLIDSVPTQFEVEKILEILQTVPLIKKPREFIDEIIYKNKEYLILSGQSIGDYKRNIIIKSLWKPESEIRGI